jgi:tRNA nucleotidyltransferase (CCA-adding enzyme)
MRNLIYNIPSTLTADEKEIISILINVAQENSPVIEPRIAGGWVRDKVLGKESHDIDIALDTMTGEMFLN